MSSVNTATRMACGKASFSSSSCLTVTEEVRIAIPVTFVPGRARLSMRPASTGSELSSITMGIVAVARFAACCATALLDTMTSTRIFTNSLTNSSKSSSRPSVARHSIWMFLSIT